MEFSLKFDTTAMQHAIEAAGDRAPRAIARALNRSAVSAKTFLGRAVAKDLGIRVSDVNRSIQVIEASASANRMSAFVIIEGKRIPLLAFNPKPRRGGLTAKFPGGAGFYPGAFIATMPNKKKGVWMRVGTKRLPLRKHELRGPSFPHVFAKYIPPALVRGEESLQKNLASELKFQATQA